MDREMSQLRLALSCVELKVVATQVRLKPFAGLLLCLILFTRTKSNKLLCLPTADRQMLRPVNEMEHLGSNRR